ncbi:hypothetical protein [Campylobacter sp. MG1]|uniref:hypothetical protein n=1 Tax=Campylobacter sp. MG1 TaxID=2976332 RepID=UPI00226C881F|nr:hypothetical protein [Campylobacter sp. MG1]
MNKIQYKKNKRLNRLKNFLSDLDIICDKYYSNFLPNEEHYIYDLFELQKLVKKDIEITEKQILKMQRIC